MPIVHIESFGKRVPAWYYSRQSNVIRAGALR
jgi:hypothetical protein